MSQLLGVSNIAVDDLVEGQLFPFLEVVFDLFRPGNNLTAYSILRLFHLGVDVVCAEGKGDMSMPVSNVCLSHSCGYGCSSSKRYF